LFNSPQVHWTEALDLELANRWFAYQHYRSIARDMTISAAAIRSRATRLGLPGRSRALLIDHFDPNSEAATKLRASFVQRRCRVSGVLFWTTRDGPRVSPLARSSRRYAALCDGLEQGTFGW
jgi:hypothetical protein